MTNIVILKGLVKSEIGGGKSMNYRTSEQKIVKSGGPVHWLTNYFNSYWSEPRAIRLSFILCHRKLFKDLNPYKKNEVA